MAVAVRADIVNEDVDPAQAQVDLLGDRLGAARRGNIGLDEQLRLSELPGRL